MNKVPTALALALAVSQPALAAASHAPDESHASLERVKRINLFRGIDSWRQVDNDTVIIWATPFRPYLVDLSREARNLRYANTIGVTSSVGGVYDKFDSVIVDGIRYRIDGIYKLDRKTARKIGMPS